MEKCACKGFYLDRLIQPAILTVLAKGSSYGHEMISKIKENGMIAGGELDPAGFYRTVKKMEEADLISSKWDTETSKPRKMLFITKGGEECLQNWKLSLTEYRSSIDIMLREIDEIKH